MSEYTWPWENYQDRTAVARSAWPSTVQALPVGAPVTGTVVGRQPFGAFLAIDGAPEAIGLARVNAKPRCLQLPSVGEQVTGRVIWHADHNHQVGIQLTPWAEHPDLLPHFATLVGHTVPAVVTRLVPFGAFARLADCVEGLLPTAELPAAPLIEGQPLDVTIATLDLDRRRLTLRRAAGHPPVRNLGPVLGLTGLRRQGVEIRES